MLSYETYTKLVGLQLEYGEASLFFRYGFDASGECVVCDWLATTVKALVSEQEYDTKMTESAFSATWESARAKSGRSNRRAGSVLALPSNEWQRPHKLQGYNRRRQEDTFARLYGRRLRSRSADEARDSDDIEVE